MYLKKNIEHLRHTDPVLAEGIINTSIDGDEYHVVTAKNGQPTLKVKGILLHSMYDPEKEASEWLKKYNPILKEDAVFCVFGFGLGYHLEQLFNYHPDIKIIIFEPDLKILKLALTTRDLGNLLKKARIIINKDIPYIKNRFFVLRHQPSIKLNSEYFDKINERLKLLSLYNKSLRIAVIGPIYGGSLPVASYTANALEKLGHIVKYIDFSIFKDAFLSLDKIFQDRTIKTRLQEQFISLASNIALAICQDFKPDIIIALAQAPLNPDILNEFRKINIPTVFWFVEDFRVMTYWKEMVDYYDFFFTIQKDEFFNLLRQRGVKHFYYLPLAADPTVHTQLKLSKDELKEYGSDISFVGAGYYNRRCMFEGLLDFDFRIWGNEWDLNSPLKDVIQRNGERIDTDECVRIFNATKININLHSSPWHRGVNPEGDFVNPRTFEIAACGAFQLVDYRSLLPELYDIGREIICFSSLDDLRNKIKYYLEHEDERVVISEKAREKTLKNHTYQLRLEEMLEYVYKHCDKMPTWGISRQPVDDLIENSLFDPELTEYLKNFSNRGSVNLDDIIEEINNSKGELKRVEKIFILMNQIKKVYIKQ